jgi:hypothetical protein
LGVDNLTLQSGAPATPAAAVIIATRSVIYSGDGTQIGVAGLVKFSGADDAKTATDVDPANEANQALMVTSLQLIDNMIAGAGVNVSQVGGVAPAMNTGNSSAGTRRVVLASDQPIVAVSVDGSTIPAATPKIISALTNTAQTVIAAPHILDAYHIFNPSAATAYVQIYDTAGAVVVGTTVAVWSIGIKAGESVSMNDVNLNFAAGIKVAATTTSTGGTAPGVALEANFSYR